MADDTSYGTGDAVTAAIQKHSDMVRRICFIYLQNKDDVDDVFQDVFLKLFQRKEPFDNDEHEKAWLCRITINKCKDICKSFFRKNISIDKVELPFEDKTENDVMRAVISLQPKYKEVIYLFYYEEYTVPEIAKLLNHKENTIYSILHRAREILRRELGGSENEELF